MGKELYNFVLAAVSILMLPSVLSTANGDSCTWNPASQYCADLGYQPNQDDCTCNFPDGTSCDLWKFFYGECGQNHSYCEQHNGIIETKIENMGTWTAIYAVCNFNDFSVCQEQEFMDGKCNKSECTNWTLSNGCQGKIALQEGILSKTAKIQNGTARSMSDIMGWDYVTKMNGTCYSFYAAQPPLIGMTQPVEIRCPLGIREITSYAVDAQQVLEILQSMDCGDAVVEMSLSWPLVPSAEEPVWHILTNTGSYLSIGANSGSVLVGCQSA
ncbi:MAG: DUF333 domain-containing protein [Methanothrix sp.]